MDEILTCKYSKCKKFYESPIILPCFNSCCKKHIDDIENELSKFGVEENKFLCEFCNEIHEIPESGFKLNNEIHKILNLNSHLSDKQKEIQFSLKYLESSINEFLHLSKDPEYFLWSTVSDIINKVDVTREKLKEKIDLIAEDLLAKLKEWHLDCKSSLKNPRSLIEIVRFEKESLKKEKLNEWYGELRYPNISNTRLEELFHEINLNIEENKNSTKCLKNSILNKKSCYFKPTTKEFLQEDFGLFILKDFSLKNGARTLTEQSGICLKTLHEHTDYVRCVLFLEKENKLISGSRDSTIKIWDLELNKCIHTLEGHTNAVVCIDLLSNNKLISGSWDNTIKIWDLNTFKMITSLNNHTDSVRDMIVKDSFKLISASNDASIKIWDMANFKVLKTLLGHSLGVCCLKMSNYGDLISGSIDKTIKIWSLDTYECISTLTGHTGYVFCLEMMSDGHLISGSNDHMIKMWQINTGACIKTLINDTPVSCLRLLSDDILIQGSASKYENIKLWDLNKNETISVFHGHTYTVFGLYLLNDGNLVSVSGDKTIKIWNV